LQDTFYYDALFSEDENLVNFIAIPAGIVCARHLHEEGIFLKFM